MQIKVVERKFNSCAHSFGHQSLALKLRRKRIPDRRLLDGASPHARHAALSYDSRRLSPQKEVEFVAEVVPRHFMLPGSGPPNHFPRRTQRAVGKPRLEMIVLPPKVIDDIIGFSLGIKAEEQPLRRDRRHTIV